MKYFSEILNKCFDTEKECKEAEEKRQKELEEKKKKEEQLSNERKSRAKEVEDALKEVALAREKYNKLLSEFCKDYGAFHYTFSKVDNSLDDIFDNFILNF